MRRRSLILFDLDGTLTDPGLGITNSVMYALERFGIRETDRSRLYPFIGPPLTESFQRFYGFSPEDARRAVDVYREYFRDRGIFENKVYPGIPGFLERLCRDGRRLAVATSKPEPFALRIVEHFGLSEFFVRVAGAAMDETRTRKEEVIRYALAELGSPAPEDTLMVGDREHDVIGAAACGIETLGVLYGYGSREELLRAGAEYLADTPEAAGDLILNTAAAGE